MTRGVVWACWTYAALVLAVMVGNAAGPERWWPFAVNMFLPQIVWAIPSLVLIPLTLWTIRRWAWLPLATLLCVIGPLMGLTWSTPPEPEGVPLRVMTYNVQLWNESARTEVLREIRQSMPDILCLQDARGTFASELGSLLNGWSVAAQGQYVIASRFPIVNVQESTGRPRRGQASYTVQVLAAGRHLTIVNAHLATPRAPLTAFQRGEVWERGVPMMNRNLSQRVSQAQALADSVRALTGPVIVAGDLNAPPQSLVSRRLTDIGLIDAFSDSGRGYGYTFGHEEFFGRSFVRIDRILVSRHFAPVRTFVGGTQGSDHRPVVAELLLTSED